MERAKQDNNKYKYREKSPFKEPFSGKIPSPPPKKKIGKALRICKVALENPDVFCHFLVKNTLVNPALFSKNWPKLGVDGWGILGVRLRMKGVLRPKLHFFTPKLLGYG